MPPLGIAPRLSAPQAEVLLLYYSGRARGGAGHRSRISTLRRLYATIYNTPPCVRPPGLEPESYAWKAQILPLYYGCVYSNKPRYTYRF